LSGYNKTKDTQSTRSTANMSGLQPVSMYSMRIPPGDFMLPAVPDHAAMVGQQAISVMQQG